MSVTATLWEHANFGGQSLTADSGHFRYAWAKYGSAQNDFFSSARAWAAGNRGNVYFFEHINFMGRFAALNVGGAFSSSWWWYFGDGFNDRVSSTLTVARNAAEKETAVPLRGVVTSQFNSLFDARTAGKPVSRDGDSRMYATYFPDYDQDRAFATMDQNLTVQVRIPLKTKIWNPFGDDWEIDLGQVRWSDYKAKVRYDILFSVADDGTLQGAAWWSYVWVESGLFSKKVSDELAPDLHAAKKDITSAIQGQLALLNGRRKFVDAYLLPGGNPDMNTFGTKGSFDDDVTLVVVDR